MLARPDLPSRHPQNVPLSEWTDGWLVLSVCCHTDALYMTATDAERTERNWPVGRQAMIDLLVAEGDIPAAGV